ncbi:MAG: hypothetical protein DWQ01_13685 [Planctomycetota bacterium]|nr:MAG: hypothetical protein DWQ01_13685 [Planctomycetota bacterium]
MTTATKPISTGILFRGPFVWSGVVFALAGYLAEEFISSELSFEFFLLFGGLFIGIGYERNRWLQMRTEQEERSENQNSKKN